MKYYVMHNDTDVIWCWQNEAFEKLTTGWTLFGIADSEQEADILCEEACY